MVATQSDPALTRSTEDYLKAIYELGGECSAVQTSAIAETLDVSAASVSGMLKRLAEAALLEHLPYRGVRLTEDGRWAAVRVVRRHRILESYLVTQLDTTGIRCTKRRSCWSTPCPTG